MKTMQEKALATLGVIVAGTSAMQASAAPIAITSLTQSYTENFDSLASSGTSSTVPAGWEFAESGSNANTTYSADTGSSNSGNTYSYGASSGTTATDRAFGGLQSGSLIPTIGVSFINNTTATISGVAISYVGEQYRLGATGTNRTTPDRLDFQYSTNATSLTTGTFTDFNALDFVAPVTSGSAGTVFASASVSASLTGLNLAPGATLYIRFSDFNATSSDDGLAIDNFSVVVPEPASVAGLLAMGAALIGRRRR